MGIVGQGIHAGEAVLGEVERQAERDPVPAEDP